MKPISSDATWRSLAPPLAEEIRLVWGMSQLPTSDLYDAFADAIQAPIVTATAPGTTVADVRRRRSFDQATARSTVAVGTTTSILAGMVIRAAAA